MSNFTALTGKVDLDTYNQTNHDMFVQFGFYASGLIGNSVNLNDFIDVGNFAEQSFVVTKEALGLSDNEVDEFTITMARIGGSKATVKFDTFQIEQTGTPAVFKVFSNRETDFHCQKVKFVFADALA